MTVAIYGASRQIYSRELKVKSGVNHLLNDSEDLRTRIKRNQLILTAAKDESEKLLVIYKETLDILKKYRDTKDESLLAEDIKETHDFNMREYIDKGNFAFPLSIFRYYSLPHDRYGDILAMRDKAISDAESLDDLTDDIEYNEIIYRTKELGLEKKFEEAYKILKKAHEIKPDRLEAIWGLATTAHHIGNLISSRSWYDKLIEKDSETNRFKFERAQVILCIDPAEGVEELRKVMESTDEFDFFLLNLGRIYRQAKMFDQAIIAMENYLKKFPVNIEAMKELYELYRCYVFDYEKAEKLNRKIESMTVK